MSKGHNVKLFNSFSVALPNNQTPDVCILVAPSDVKRFKCERIFLSLWLISSVSNGYRQNHILIEWANDARYPDATANQTKSIMYKQA
jgi:hypothetical protein